MLARFLLIAVALALSACGAPKTLDPSALGLANSVTNGTADYKLAAGDKIRVIVFNEPTLSGEFTVSSDGMLALPLIGSVSAMGKTTGTLATEVTGQLASGYLKDPRVSMEVLTFRPFYILGEVNKPGQFPYAAGLTVLNAVATAEGFTYRAERRVAYIRRAGTNSEIPVRITPDLQISPGDTIRIGERYF